MIRVMIFTVIAIMIFRLAISFINKIRVKEEEEVINLNNNRKVEVLMLIVIALINFKFKGIDLIFIYILTIYLMITAYIDFKTKYVYTILNIITGCLGIIYLIIKCSTISELINSSIYIGIFTLITFIFTKFNAYGAGDNDIYIVISLFLYKSSYGIFNLEIMLINILFSNIIAIILVVLTNITKIEWKKLKFKDEIAFVPSISIATLILMMLL